MEITAPIQPEGTTLARNPAEPPKEIAPPAEVLAMDFKMPEGLNIAPENKPDGVIDASTLVPTETIVPNSEVKTESDVKKPAEVKVPVEKKIEEKKTEVKTEPKVEDKKIEDKPKPKTPLDILKKPGTSSETKKTDGKVERDYSVFDSDEEKEAAKQMSNIAFDQFKGMKIALKGAAQQKPDIFYQHPEAYRSHPEYLRANTNLQYGMRELQYWNQQLDLCKQGKPYKKLLSYDQNNNPVFSAEIQPTSAGEEDLRQAVINTRTNLQGINNTIKNFPNQYKQEFSNLHTTVQSERQKRFAWASDPSVLKSTIDLGGDLGEKSIEAIRNDFISLFPRHLVNDDAVQVGADLLAMHFMTKKFYEQQLAEHTVNKTIASEEKMVEPTSDVRPVRKDNSAWGGVTEFNAATMPAVS